MSTITPNADAGCNKGDSDTVPVRAECDIEVIGHRITTWLSSSIKCLLLFYPDCFNDPSEWSEGKLMISILRKRLKNTWFNGAWEVVVFPEG